MTEVYQIQGLLIGLIGWAATALMVLNWSRLNSYERHAMVVFSWTLWMIPAFGALVYRGLLDTNTAAFYCGGTTIALAVVASVSAARLRTRP